MKIKNTYLPNPQGKASVPLLNDLANFTPYGVTKKELPHWLADYFTSILVLSAKFSFKPIIDKQYYLYLDQDHWKLSLIEPQKWKNCPFQFFATCIMGKDKSWTLQPLENWQDNPQFKHKISQLSRYFLNSLDISQPIVDSLPFYVASLPYYQRVAANALANSLKQSLQLKLGKEISESMSSKVLLREVSKADLSPARLLNHANSA